MIEIALFVSVTANAYISLEAILRTHHTQIVRRSITRMRMCRLALGGTGIAVGGVSTARRGSCRFIELDLYTDALTGFFEFFFF
jgi:hypothetical protein